jgi:hypothetical protein
MGAIDGCGGEAITLSRRKEAARVCCVGNSSGDEINSSVIRIYDAAGNGIETHEHKVDFKEW